MYLLRVLAYLLVAGAAVAAENDARQTFAALLKIPLAAPAVQVTVEGTREEDGLRVEDVWWTSLDGERVPARVIRPAGATGRLPAVICLHGTGGSRDSETTAAFGDGEWTRPGQKAPHKRFLGWARELARRGFLTISITQRGLDTRTPDTNDQSKFMLVNGRTLMGAIVHEIRQTVTYLESRSDVRRNAIGVTGMSFGGITAFYTWLVDARVAAAAPICGGVGSVNVLLKRGTPAYHGFYWWIPDMLTKGDQGDFAAQLAPRPLMLWAPRQDIGMPAEGVDLFVTKVKPAYERARAGDKLVIHTPPGEHSFTMAAFDALLAFLKAQLG